MEADPLRLSRIETLWSVVRHAHVGSPDEMRSAQRQLLDRYAGAIRRYLLAALRNEDAADEVFQEFSLRFVRGDFENTTPDRGRFRSFVKSVLFHLIVDYQRRRGRERRQQPLVPEVHAAACEADSPEDQDRAFVQSWRDDLLSRGWQALQDDETRTGKPYYTVLRFRADHPELNSAGLAEQLTAQWSRPITANHVRVILHRARELFAERLLQAVTDSLANSHADLEEELIELNLLEYCRPVLERKNL